MLRAVVLRATPMHQMNIIKHSFMFCDIMNLSELSEEFVTNWARNFFSYFLFFISFLALG